MRVFDFGGETECKTIEELNELLNKRYENNSNELELYGSENYPFMTILVVDKWACIHFFKDEDDCGHYAFCDENTLDKDGYTIFYTGSATVETEISNQMVIPFSLAVEVAQDFFLTLKMSNKLNWFEI